MNIVALIPARSGSKSIPLKNIQLLNNKPLIAYSIEYANRCNLISHTVVSTDSTHIASISNKYNAETPFIRPVEISGDKTPDFPVIEHALNEMELMYRYKIDAIVWLRPTSPLRPEKLIEKSVEILFSTPGCTSVRSVIQCNEHYYRQWKARGKFIEGVAGRGVVEPYNLPRQQLPNVFFQSGDIEVVKRDTIIGGSMSGDNIAPIIIDQKDMLDIDYLEDFEYAKYKLNAAE